MTRLIKIDIIITGLFFIIMPMWVNSQHLQEHRQTVVEYEEPLEDDVKYEDEIKNNEIPEGVVNSLKSTYPDHEITTAYKGSDGSFKIRLTLNEEKIAAFYNATGEFLKLEEDKEEDEESTNEQWR